MPTKAAKVPRTAWMTMPSPNCASNTLLIAPRATPSAAAKARTSAGLMTALEGVGQRQQERPTGTEHRQGQRPAVGVLVDGVDVHDVTDPPPGGEGAREDEADRDSGLLDHRVDRHPAVVDLAGRAGVSSGRVAGTGTGVGLVAVGVRRGAVELLGTAEHGVVALHWSLLGGLWLCAHHTGRTLISTGEADALFPSTRPHPVPLRIPGPDDRPNLPRAGADLRVPRGCLVAEVGQDDALGPARANASGIYDARVKWLARRSSTGE